MRKKSAHLTYDDRVRIETLLGEGASLRYITDRLDKAPSTISREIRKHTQLKPVHKCYDCLCLLRHLGIYPSRGAWHWAWRGGTVLFPQYYRQPD